MKGAIFETVSNFLWVAVGLSHDWGTDINAQTAAIFALAVLWGSGGKRLLGVHYED